MNPLRPPDGGQNASVETTFEVLEAITVQKPATSTVHGVLGGGKLIGGGVVQDVPGLPTVLLRQPVLTGGITPVPGGTIPTGTTGGTGTGIGGTEGGATRFTVSTAIKPLVYGLDDEYAES